MTDTLSYYEGYREEDRFTVGKARRVEYLTTLRALDEAMPKGRTLSILDNAAGTGAYALHYAARGHDVTALDLAPRHVAFMREALKDKSFTMAVDQNDATDLSRFAHGTFDVVLCMGPLYHLTDAGQRERGLSECVRVAKPGGLVAVAYISRFSILAMVMLRDSGTRSERLMDKILTDGAMRAHDPDCFWTDNFFATPEGIEEAVAAAGCDLVDHFAADGIAPLHHEAVDRMNEADFALLCEYQWRTCRERTLLGSSGHGMVIGRKRA